MTKQIYKYTKNIEYWMNFMMWILFQLKKQKSKKPSQALGVAQWQSICLACMRPRILSLKKRETQVKKKQNKKHPVQHPFLSALLILPKATLLLKSLTIYKWLEYPNHQAKAPAYFGNIFVTWTKLDLTGA